MFNIENLIQELLTDHNCLYNGDMYLNDSDFKIQNDIKNIAKVLNISLLDEESHKYLMWDGKCIRYKYITIANILHEFAHFQVALDNNRYLPDFGLSIGPDSDFSLDLEIEQIPRKEYKHHLQNQLYYNWSNYIDHYNSHSLQEIFASMLGILWCRALKIQSKKILIEQDWCHIIDHRGEWGSFNYSEIRILNNEIFVFDTQFIRVIETLKFNNFLDDNFYPKFKLNH